MSDYTVEIDKQYLENISEMVKQSVSELRELMPMADYLDMGYKDIPEQLLHNFAIIGRLLDFELHKPTFVPFLVKSEAKWTARSERMEGTVTILSIHT